ncbi:unnamed protein product [Ceutorhynchus assimilis]|uniref:DNA topoisomerase 2-binding protein 1 n=1 Tax=Ceutorhynchus assimilis TaxID=467358 RepID=A0A9N9MFL4_9CUCU|nr:unnamed protein product [Ceutorhynchus assimilis]
MTDIKVTFVLPNNIQDESEASDVMKRAYKSCKELVPDTIWDKESNLINRDLSKKDYLIFEEFEGKDFSIYSESQCAIIGPLALNVCLNQTISIPNFPWPILTVSMIECEVTCTQMQKSRKEIIKNKVQLMGGLYCGDLRDSTTHLICDSTNSEKYALAAEKGVLLMLPSWIDYMFENTHINCHDIDKTILDKYKCPAFNNLTICATGLSSSKEIAQLMEIIKNNGGNLTGTLVISKTDVLVCYGTASTCSEKYKAARRSQRISCVTPDWIHDSVEKGYALRRDLEKYRVKAATSTPTRDGEIIDPNFSTISAVGQSICHKTHIDETITSRRQSYKRKADDLEEKIDIKKVKSAQHFLDGCSVFIAGFSPNCHEKLNKIINLSGATRYDEFSDRVSHVIVGDPTCSEVIKIRENCDQCYLVSVQWLLDSVEQQKPAEESKYFISNSDETGKILSEKVINILRENKTTTNESVVVDNDDVLTQKYLRMAVRDDEAQMTDNQIKTRIFQHRYVSTDMSEIENFKFRLEGFSEEIIKKNKSLIASAGGTVVDCFFKGICNYAIVPVIYNPKELLPALEIVNNLWLNENLETQTLISDIKYYHRHINLTSTDVLSECVVTISGYTDFEREFLQTIIIGLGAIYQEQFSKKTNTAKNVLGSTHLISLEASGKKYEAALRWNLPVTTKDWLLACAKTGKQLPLENYLIGESKTSNNETLNTTIVQKTVTPEKQDAPKTPKNLTQENFSQVTPINKILEDAVNSKLLPTPARPKQYYPWDPKTPETPLGAFIRPNPSPGLRKELQKYVNSFPDFVPPERRLSVSQEAELAIQELNGTTLEGASEPLKITFTGDSKGNNRTVPPSNIHPTSPARRSFPVRPMRRTRYAPFFVRNPFANCMFPNVAMNRPGWTLFVDNLHFEIEDIELWQLFGPFGAVQSVKVMRDLQTNQCRGFGFVKMTNYVEALSAIDFLNGYTLCNRKLQVRFKTASSGSTRSDGLSQISCT